MADQNTNIPSNSAPEIQDRTAKAPGIIPKNAQTRIMMLAIATTIQFGRAQGQTTSDFYLGTGPGSAESATDRSIPGDGR